MALHEALLSAGDERRRNYAKARQLKQRLCGEKLKLMAHASGGNHHRWSAALLARFNREKMP